MDQDARDRWSALAHRSRRFCSPVDEDRFAALVETLPLPAAPYSVDFGSGKGAALVQVVQLRGGTATGVDRSARMLDDAQSGGAPVTYIEADASQWRPEVPPDLAMCIGSTHIFGGLATAAVSLAAIVRPGGSVVLGDLYWRMTPDAGDVETFGMTVEDLSDLADTVACVEQAGLTPIAVQPSTTAEWDAYEWSLTRSIEQWARESPESADRELFLARTRSMRNSYLRWRRDALGFALVAAVREGP